MLSKSTYFCYNTYGDKMKKLLTICLTIILLSGCQPQYKLYTYSFIGPFDTVSEYMSYAKSQDEFNKQCQYVEKQLTYYDHLFDKYTTYDNINNIATINQNAGKNEIKVEDPLIDLLSLSIERNQKISSKVNIGFGSVIDIWHEYREKAQQNNGIGKIPSNKQLQEANQHTQIENIHIDKIKKTVYIDDKHMTIDVGAVAKGYAIELIKDELIGKGIDNFLLSGGGNVVSHGERKIEKDGELYLKECRNQYCVGIESPKDGNYSQNDYEAILIAHGKSIVTSGDYQRFYKDQKGVKYHHLISPDTLFPAIYFRSVSVVCEDSGVADFLSSALFLTEYEEGLKLVESLEGVEAIWLLDDGKIRMSSGLKDNEEIYVIEKERLK